MRVGPVIVTEDRPGLERLAGLTELKTLAWVEAKLEATHLGVPQVPRTKVGALGLASTVLNRRGLKNASVELHHVGVDFNTPGADLGEVGVVEGLTPVAD